MRPDRARRILERRLAGRAADFLALTRGAVFANPVSPYRWLFAQAGCEYGDLERLVLGEGLEGALGALFQRGVFLTVDEFKGRVSLRRGSAVTTVDPAALRNPGTAWHVPIYTSGSRGERMLVPLDLDWYRARSVDVCLWLDAIGGAGWQQATWSVPGGNSLNAVLEFAAVDSPLRRWFTPIAMSGEGLDGRYRWTAWVLDLMLRGVGIPHPRPEVVTVDDALVIVGWMTETLRAGAVPHLDAFPSMAVRLCQAAQGAGMDVSGVRFLLSGEPVTAARLRSIHAVGATAEVRYGTMEAGPIGLGCLRPSAPDAMHLWHDLNAVIAASLPATDDLERPALLISSLRPSAPIILLNVSLGDTAELTRSACGCPMEALGWTTSLRDIRSFEKLTAGGMAFLDRDIIAVLEEVLPDRFGGSPTDYQLVESESVDGWPELSLLVHPRVGEIDEAVLADTFLAAIGGGRGPERVMELQLRQAHLLRVRRAAPRLTANGKIQHLHVERSTRERVAGAAGST
jgi:hypothetical protein